MHSSWQCVLKGRVLIFLFLFFPPPKPLGIANRPCKALTQDLASILPGCYVAWHNSDNSRDILFIQNQFFIWVKGKKGRGPREWGDWGRNLATVQRKEAAVKVSGLLPPMQAAVFICTAVFAAFTIPISLGFLVLDLHRGWLHLLGTPTQGRPEDGRVAVSAAGTDK